MGLSVGGARWVPAKVSQPNGQPARLTTRPLPSCWQSGRWAWALCASRPAKQVLVSSSSSRSFVNWNRARPWSARCGARAACCGATALRQRYSWLSASRAVG